MRCPRKGESCAKEPTGTFTVLLLGDKGVGKTTLMESFLSGGPEACARAEPTNLMGMGVKTVAIGEDGGKTARLIVWDSSGADEFAALLPPFMRHPDAVAIAFSVDDARSAESVPAWHALASREAPPAVAWFVVANKCEMLLDSPACVRVHRRGFELASSCDIGAFHGTDASTGYGVERLFDAIARRLLGCPPPPPRRAPRPAREADARLLALERLLESEERGCCVC